MRVVRVVKSLLTWPTFFGLLPIVIAIVVSGYITYRYNLSVTEIRSEVEHSLTVTTAIDDVLIDLQDLETGQRGYLITGDEAYLEPFEAARSRFETDLKDLRSMVFDDSEYDRLINSISELADAKLKELDQTITERREKGFDAAQAIVRNNEGKTTMDKIRDLVSDLRSTEAERLKQQTEEMRHTENRVVLIVVLTVALGVVGRLLGLVLPAWWLARKNA